MERILLLTRSNLRKNRGTSIGMFFLMLISSCLICLAFLLLLDAYPTASKEAVRLNGGDGILYITGDTNGFTDAVLEDLIGEDTDEYYVYNELSYSTVSVPFGNGNVSILLSVSDSSAFRRDMNTAEVVIEDEAVTGPYIYLPYQFNTSGGYNTGDTYEYVTYGTKHVFKIKGFTNLVYGGNNNSSRFEFIVDDASFASLRDADAATSEEITVVYDLKEGVKPGSFAIKNTNAMLAANPNAVVRISDIQQTVLSRTFMTLIFAVSFFVLNTIVVAVVAMMTANSISNYIKENMKTIGALKAIGYTGKDIKASLITWFVLLALLASVTGVAVAYLSMPVFASVVIGQMGHPYQVGFNMLATVIPVLFIVAFALVVTLLSTSGISRIHPIVALREGMESHNFKKNYFALNKTAMKPDICLAMKACMNNMKQNVITFFVCGFMVFACVVSLLMYENFSRHPKMDLMTIEICAGTVCVDPGSAGEVRDYLENRAGIENVREILSGSFNYNDEESLYAYIVEDTSALKNQKVCYSGRLPQHDNEVVVSGKFASDYGYKIGDEIKLDYGDESYNYLITGFIQTTNNQGREALMTLDASDHLIDRELLPDYFWFDLADEAEEYDVNQEYTDTVFEDCKDRFGDKILTTLNFYEIMKGNLTTFQSISTMMLFIMFSISAVVIGLVLYLFVKSFIYHKRKDYGIYKALGYTSGSLMRQTALSFMPSIVLSVAVFSVVWYYMANPYMSLFMGLFGLMKCDFDVPVTGVVIIAIGFILVAFICALWQTRRIRKIEAYNMLVSE